VGLDLVIFDSDLTPATFWVKFDDLDLRPGAPGKKLQLAGGKTCNSEVGGRHGQTAESWACTPSAAPLCKPSGSSGIIGAFQRAMTVSIPKEPGVSCDSAAPPFGIVSEAACLPTRNCLACNAHRAMPVATRTRVRNQPNKDLNNG
jgi:hypothetical protein